MHPWMPCHADLATLGNAKQAHVDTHATVLLQGRNNPTPSMQQYIATAMFKAQNQELLANQMTKTWANTVDGNTEQIFGSADLVPCITCVSTCAKGFQFSPLTFQKCTGSIGLCSGQYLVPFYGHAVTEIRTRITMTVSYIIFKLAIKLVSLHC